MKKIRKIIDFFISYWNKTVCFIKNLCLLFKNIYLKRVPETDYIDLAPMDNIEDCDEHIKVLQWAIANPKIKNIALSGPYGSGKSSIIQTFLNYNPLIKEKSIQVSLATFHNKNKEIIKPLDLEKGILKQLFYKVKQTKIPQSRYKRICITKYITVLLLTLLCVLITSGTIFIFWPSLCDFVNDSILEAGNKLNMSEKWANGISLVIFSIILFLVAKVIQLFVSRFSIKNVKLFKGAGDFSTEHKETEILSKNIDEIMYFFEKTRMRVVFFEDLDRFDDVSIFVKLREINTILNNSDSIKDNVIFVYAINDDTFTSEERTKFFEFIIPVIPVINSTNSGEILLELLSVDGEDHKCNITQEYILDVSPFISDMRVLNNIYNEFLIYKQIIKDNQGLRTLSDEIMMSLIIFKNLHPDQFALLQNEKGIVKSAFELKNSFIAKKKEELRAKIDTHREMLNNIDEDVLNSQYELKAAMLCALSGWKGVATSITLSGNRTIYASSVLQDSFDMSYLLKDGRWSIRYLGANGSSETVTINNMYDVCSPYIERFNYLKHSSKDQKEFIKSQIEHIEAEAQLLTSLSMKELINRFGSKVFFNRGKESEENNKDTSQSISDQIYSNKVLEFMLRKGYINEDYASYINYFKGNSISASDMEFILSVKTQSPKPFSYQLSQINLPQIVAKLQPHEFSERAILNFNMLEFLLENNSNYGNKLGVYMEKLSDGYKDSWNFINEFIDQTKQQKLFIKMLSQKWPDLWNYIYEETALTYERQLYYLSLLCLILSIEELSLLNVRGNITKFFVDNEDILQKLSKDVIVRLEYIIPALGINFSKLNIAGVSNKLLDFIFDNCYYEINPHMINNIVMYKNNSLCDSLEKHNYTTITKLGYEPLIGYVHDNFELYTERIILEESNTEEDSSSVLKILNRICDKFELCNRVIKHLDFQLDFLSEVFDMPMADNVEYCRSICDMLMINNKLVVSWDSVYGYWQRFGVSIVLCNYIVRQSDILAKQNTTCLCDEFKESIILSKMDIKSFTKIISKIRINTFTIGLNQISEEKLYIMVNNRTIEFTEANYNQMKEYAPKLCVKFILLNQDSFKTIFDQLVLDVELVEELIICYDLSNDIKKIILERYGVDYMTETIANYLCEKTITINREVFEAAWDILNNTSKQEKLLFRYLNILVLEDFERYLAELDKPYSNLKRNTYRHEELLPDNKENRALVNRLRAVQYLTSIEYETKTYAKPQREVPVIRCRVKAMQA